jgi:AAT family amino acid transporter
LEGQDKTHLLPFRNCTYPWGPWFSVVPNVVLVLVWGWGCLSPSFDIVAFINYYLELPIVLFMYMGWKLWKQTSIVPLSDTDLETDVYEIQPREGA